MAGSPSSSVDLHQDVSAGSLLLDCPGELRAWAKLAVLGAKLA